MSVNVLKNIGRVNKAASHLVPDNFFFFFWWGLGRAGSGDFKTFSSIPDLYPVDVSSIPVAMTTKMAPDTTVFP